MDLKVRKENALERARLGSCRTKWSNNVDHLLSASCVNRHLQMPDLDAEITTETVKNRQ